MQEVFMADNNGSGFLWFLAGLGIGAAVGVLYAPRPGAETRDALRARAEEGRDQVRQQARRVREQANDWIDRGKEAVSQHRESFRTAYEAGRQAYREKTAEPGPQNL
jgi:gas vesicle protein